MSPYREPSPFVTLTIRRPWYARWWTRLLRRLSVFVRGSFKKRYPIKCDVCGKPSKYEGGGDTIYIQNTFIPCGHEYTFWRRLKGMRQTQGGGPG